MSKGPVSFHDAPAEKSNKYQDVIQRARASRVPDRPGDMTGTPHFEDTAKSWESRKPERTQISPSTAAGLSALAQSNARPPAPPVEEAEEEPRQEVAAEAVEEDEADKLRKAVEARIRGSIDIGEYLVNGEAPQVVPNIPGKLEITFRSVTDQEEAYVDAQLSKNRETTARVFLRGQNEWALTFHIVAVNGNKWPNTIVNGEINETAVEKRLGHVRKLSSPIFQLITQNLVWFLERVNKAITMEVLGNG